MIIIIKVINFIFGLALFVNALLFIPQAVKIVKIKSSKEFSLITFFGFCIIQISAVLYGIVHHDYILVFGYFLSLITCGTIVGLIVFFKLKELS
jgi:uncharacterized protein with PQ loop repeat